MRLLSSLLNQVFAELFKAASVVFLFFFVGLKGSQTVDQFVEIDVSAVEVGAVNASELHFAANGNTAATAHTSAVHHQGAQGNDGFHAEGLCSFIDSLHHGHGTQGVDLVILFASFQDFLELVDNLALFALRAVFGQQVQIAGSSLEAVFQDDEILGTEADDDVGFNACIVQAVCDGISDSET